VRLFLYGKKDARPGRKMGHLLASGESSADAIERVCAALAAL
jgi:5-(carboxyamino)imidazole ribonucleotide synthase